MRFHPLLPWIVILLCGAAIVAAVLLTRKYALNLPRRRKNILTLLRLTSVTLLLIMLFCPGIRITEPDRSRSGVVFLLDASGSMSVSDMPGGISRYEAACRVLDHLRKRLPSRQESRVILYRENAVPVQPDHLWLEKPSGTTRLKAAFESAGQDPGFDRISAIVILSDALDHSRFTGIPPSVPVYAVRTGSDLSRLPDLGIGHLETPGSVRAGEELKLEIPVRLNGFPAAADAVLTVHSGKQVLLKQALKLKPGETRSITFRHPFRTPGLYRLTLELNHLPGEITLLNNRRELLLEVRDEPVRPLLYFPVLNASFRPLLRHFQESGWKFTAVYRLRKNVYGVLGNAGENRLFSRGIAGKKTALETYDAVILGSGSDEALSDGEIRTLEQYVSGGGTLITLGGKNAYGPFRSRLFASMMPVRSRRSAVLDGVFTFILPENSLFRKEDLPASLPGIHTVDQVRSNSELLLRVRDSAGHEFPLAAVMPYGRGRTGAVLTHALFPVSGTQSAVTRYRNFWEQLLACCTGSDHEKLHAELSSDYIPSGASVRLSVRSSGKKRVTAELLPEDGTRPEEILRLETDPAGRGAGVFRNVPAGNWVIRVTADSGKQDPLRRYLGLTAGKVETEYDDLRSSDDLFPSAIPRKNIFLPEETPKVLEQLNAVIRKQDRVREYFPVLENPVLPVLLLLLLLAEWFLRRKYNMT